MEMRRGAPSAERCLYLFTFPAAYARCASSGQWATGPPSSLNFLSTVFCMWNVLSSIRLIRMTSMLDVPASRGEFASEFFFAGDGGFADG